MLRDFDACRLEALLAMRGPEGRRETVGLAESLGRISAEDVYSPCNIPAHPTSIKDGYAVRSADVTSPGQAFEIQFVDLAGHSSLASVLGQGKAAYVTTGSPIPFGSDAVVEMEQTTRTDDGGGVRINLAALAKGKDVRQVGSDLKLFELVVRKGCGIGVGEIGALASIGKFTDVGVYRRPTVGVLTTGDELVEGGLGAGLGYGQVYDCNKPMLLAAVRELGCVGVDLGLVRDSEAGSRLREAIAHAFETVDVVITTGGVSVGAADCVRLLLLQNSADFTVLFDRVNVKPGKPVTCAVRHASHDDDSPPQVMFCLPGNPVSALAMFHTLVAPCLRKLKGCDFTDPNAVMSVTTCELVLDSRPEFLRATLQVDRHTGLLHSTPTAGGLQRSSCVLSLVGCDALLCLPGAAQVARGILPQGSLVRTVVFSDWRNTHFPEPPRAPDQLPACCLVGSSSLLLERLLAATQTRSSHVSVAALGDLDQLSKAIVILSVAHSPTPPEGFLSIPGISEFLRERLGIWRELVIGCVPSRCAVLVYLPSAALEEGVTVEEFIHEAWPLLTGALQQMIIKS